MAAPQALRSGYADLVGSAMLPVLKETFLLEYNTKQYKREMIGKLVTTDTNIYQTSGIGDMPLFSSVAEGADYVAYKTAQQYNKTVSVSKYGMAANFSEELIEDSKFAHIADTLKKMAKSARESQEVSFFNLFNNGFATAGTPTLVADGLSLFNAAHTWSGSAVTVRNQLAVASDLSVSSLKTAIKDFRTQFKGDSGIIYDIKPKYLLVPEDTRLDAMEIVGSDQLAFSSDNNMNSLKNEGITVIASPYITDNNSFYLVADNSENGLRIITRKGIETKAAGGDVGFVNDSIWFKARYREAVAAEHPMGVFGSPGSDGV
jgi:phage major head subunit gpT-like protein